MDTIKENVVALQRPIRGAIKTAVSTSTENLVAGAEFSIFVNIINPFEVPVVVHRVSTYLPTEFFDVDQHLRRIRAEELEEEMSTLAQSAGEQGIHVPNIRLAQKRPLWQRIIRGFSSISFQIFGLRIAWEPNITFGPAIARDMDSPRATEWSIGINLPMLGEFAQTLRREVVQESESEALDSENQQEERMREIFLSELTRYEEQINLLRTNGEDPKPLQPGNSTTRSFSTRSRRRISFRPATYKLNIEVEYEIDGEQHRDTIEHTMHVRSSQISMLLGAMLGGVGGWFANTRATFNSATELIVSLIISLIFAAMTVVIFARKRDIQPIITVEDFWGGIAIGFIASYSGGQLITTLV